MVGCDRGFCGRYWCALALDALMATLAGTMRVAEMAPGLRTPLPAERVSYESAFCLGQRVFIDRDPELSGIVIALEFHLDGSLTAKVSRFHNGDLKEEWFSPSRLSVDGNG